MPMPLIECGEAPGRPHQDAKRHVLFPKRLHVRLPKELQVLLLYSSWVHHAFPMIGLVCATSPNLYCCPETSTSESAIDP